MIRDIYSSLFRSSEPYRVDTRVPTEPQRHDPVFGRPHILETLPSHSNAAGTTYLRHPQYYYRLEPVAPVV